jgi:hypothetical protein
VGEDSTDTSTVTIEYPFEQEVWVEMTSSLPEDSYIVSENVSERLFRIEYPDRITAEYEVERFNQIAEARYSGKSKEVPRA